MNWRRRSPPAGALSKAEELGHLPHLIRELLISRGLGDGAKSRAWLEPTLKSLRDPTSLYGMEAAVARLLAARERNEPVCIYADFDLDGTTGLALLKHGLEGLGFEQVSFYQPRRLSEGYGVHVKAVEAIFASGAKLLVTVDVGITALAAATRAAELGLDMIITDHHLAQAELPQALTIVNPNQPACRSGLGHLSGAGVAFYLLLALKRELQQRNQLLLDFDLKSLLDFFVIGTLTDLVPLVGENRVLVKHGLVQLSRTKRPGLRALLEALEMEGRALSSSDVAIKLAPKLNALSRMDQGLLPIDVLLATTIEQARKLATQALAINQLRQSLQGQAEGHALERAMAQIAQGFIFLYSSDYHQGVIGLVATKLAKALRVPAFIGALKGEVIAGSARAPDGTGLDLTRALAAAKSCLERFGGHAAAAGFELKTAHADLFAQSLQSYFADLHELPPAERIYDAEGELADINDAFVQWFDHLEPFGSHFELPLFLLRNLRLGELRRLSGGHLRLELIADRAQPRQAIWFSPEVSSEILSRIEQGESFDLLAQMGWNHFRGRQTFQLMVQDVRLPLSSPQPGLDLL